MELVEGVEDLLLEESHLITLVVLLKRVLVFVGVEIGMAVTFHNFQAL